LASWSFLTNHARVLLCIAHDPGARLRDIATSLGITERSAHEIIVTDLTEAGYAVKQKTAARPARATNRLAAPRPANAESTKVL
jgi:DNA-binding IclR family transcriptional regulator